MGCEIISSRFTSWKIWLLSQFRSADSQIYPNDLCVANETQRISDYNFIFLSALEILWRTTSGSLNWNWDELFHEFSVIGLMDSLLFHNWDWNNNVKKVWSFRISHKIFSVAGPIPSLRWQRTSPTDEFDSLIVTCFESFVTPFLVSCYPW
jgi:hypothetical protein